MTLVLTLWCMWWLYDQEFHYASTEAGRLAAVEDYVPDPADSTISHVKAGTPLRVVAYAEQGKYLHIFYAAENDENVHGILSLYRGLNGKYRPYTASRSPFPYTAGAIWEHISTRKKNDRWYAFAGDNCREIYSVRVVFNRWGSTEEDIRNFYETTFTLTEPNFLWLFEESELEQLLGIPDIGGRLVEWEMQLLDRNGNDVTEQYRNDSIKQSWGGGKGSAEMGLLYVYLGIVAILGIIFIRYFLRQD